MAIAPQLAPALGAAGAAGTSTGALGALGAGSFPTFTGAGLGAGLGGGATAALSSGASSGFLGGLGETLSGINSGISSATGGLFSGGDLAKAGLGLLSGGGPQQPQATVSAPPAQELPGAVRPEVKTTGLTATGLGANVPFGDDNLDDLQRATSIFTAINSGPGQLSLPSGSPSDPANLAAARSSLLNLGTSGGNINTGFVFPESGFAALKKLGAPAQQRTAAGGFSALRELIEREQA